MKKITLFLAVLFISGIALGQADVSPNELNKPLTQNTSGEKASWVVQFNYNTTPSLTTGIETDGNYFYLTFWKRPSFYRYSMAGVFIDSFQVTGVTQVRDLAYDGTYFYGAAANNSIFQMDFSTTPGSGTLVSTITAATGVVSRHIAYDSNNDAFWCGDFGSDIWQVSKTGVTLQTITAATHGLTGNYGSAYDTVSAGGPYLWTIQASSAGGILNQIDLATGTIVATNTHDVSTDGIGTATSSGGGLFIHPNIVSGTQTLGGIIQNECIFGYNLSALAAVAYDMSVTDCDLATLESVGTKTVSGDITNLGTTTITAYTLNYSVDGGSTQSDPITGVNIAQNASLAFSHSTGWFATAGQHELKIWATLLNGSNADLDNANDTLTMLIDVVDSTTQRLVLVEPFTNTSCAPCATYGPAFRTLLNNNISKVAVVYYHFDYPGPNDPFYLFTPDNESRCVYYGINGVPHTQMGGSYYDDHIANMTATDINTRYNTPALYEMSVSASPNGNDLDIDVDVTALLTTAAANVKLRVAIIEDEINLASAPGSNGEKDFYWTFRDMLPSAAGATAGPFTQYTAKSFNYTYTYQTGVNKDEVKVIAFLQDDNTKEILQACITPIYPYVGLQEVQEGISFGMYPNPVNNTLFMKYVLESQETVTVNVYNLLGSLMISNAQGTQTSGEHTISLDVTSLPQGVYMVELQTEKTKVVRRLIVQ
jgi:Secretion system C-terminal sorting domain/Outer membrane protein Omp28